MRRQNFLKFTKFRIVLCFGLCGIFVFCAVLCQPFVTKYLNAGNVFTHTAGALSVHFVDVGHGDCTVIKLPDGKTMVIDGGEKDYYYESRVRPYLQTRILGGGDFIDYMILTHPESDHFGGLSGILDDFNVGTVYRPATKSESPHEVAEALQPKIPPSAQYTDFITKAYTRAQEVKITATEIIAQTDTYRITAQIGSVQQGLLSSNDMSPIISVEYAAQVFLITGDAGETVEASYISGGFGAEIFGGGRSGGLTTWLKVAHHGSDGGTRYPFLNCIKPAYAVISAGEYSRTYGLPNKNTINRLDDFTADIYITRDLGNIAVTCNGEDVEIFFAFDNFPNLSWLWFTLIFGAFFACFINFEKSKKMSQNPLTPPIVHGSVDNNNILY